MVTRTIERARRLSRFEPTRSVTEILALAERPDVLSFAGGLPDPEIFPLERIRESMERVLRDSGEEALNYGANPGYSKLRDWIAERMGEKEGVSCSREHILVSSGGVEALNLVAMALLDPGDVVLVEAPTYMVALQVFRAYDARIVPVPIDDEGIVAGALSERLRELAGQGTRPKLLYSIPSFQNPSGRTLSEKRRIELVALCSEHGVPIVEDHAYAELVYDGDKLPSLKSLSPENVVLIHTFSKIFGPGVRLGWVVADPDLVKSLGLCKIGTDQCSNTLTQRLVHDYGSRGHIDEQVRAGNALYRSKRDRMEAAMRREFPPDARWVHPAGGFFIWVELDAGIDTEALLRDAIEEHKTAFVAGPCFFAEGGGRSFLRLAFSHVPADRIDDGIRRIGRAIAGRSGA